MTTIDARDDCLYGESMVLSEDQLSTLRTCLTREQDWAAIVLVPSPVRREDFQMDLASYVTKVPVRVAASVAEAWDGPYLREAEQPAGSTMIIGRPTLVFALSHHAPTRSFRYPLPRDDPAGPCPRGASDVWVLQTTIDALDTLISSFEKLLPPQPESTLPMPDIHASAVRVQLRRHDHIAGVFGDIFAGDVQTIMPPVEGDYSLIVGDRGDVNIVWPFSTTNALALTNPLPTPQDTAAAATDVAVPQTGISMTMTSQPERRREDRLRVRYRNALTQLRTPQSDSAGVEQGPIVTPAPDAGDAPDPHTWTTGTGGSVARAQALTDSGGHGGMPAFELPFRGDYFGGARQDPEYVHLSSENVAELFNWLYNQLLDARNQALAAGGDPGRVAALCSQAIKTQHAALRTLMRITPPLTGKVSDESNSQWAYVHDTIGSYRVEAKLGGRIQRINLPVIALPIPRFVYDAWSYGSAEMPGLSRPSRSRYYGPCFLSGEHVIRVVNALSNVTTSTIPDSVHVTPRPVEHLPIQATELKSGDTRRVSPTVMGLRVHQCSDGLDLAMDEALRATRLGPAYHHRRALFAAASRLSARPFNPHSPKYSAPPMLARAWATDRALALGLCTPAEAAAARAGLTRGDTTPSRLSTAEPTVAVPAGAVDVVMRILNHPHLTPEEKALTFMLIPVRARQAAALAAVCLFRARLAAAGALGAGAGATVEIAGTEPPATIYEQLYRNAIDNDGEAVKVTDATPAQILEELAQLAPVFGISVIDRLPTTSLFAGFDCDHAAPTDVASLAKPGADVTAGIAFALAAERFTALADTFKLFTTCPDGQELVQPLTTTRADANRGVDPVVAAAVTPDDPTTDVPHLNTARLAARALLPIINTVTIAATAGQGREAGFRVDVTNSMSWIDAACAGQQMAPTECFKFAVYRVTVAAADAACALTAALPHWLLDRSPAQLAPVHNALTISPAFAGMCDGRAAVPRQAFRNKQIYKVYEKECTAARAAPAPALTAPCFGRVFGPLMGSLSSFVDQSFGESLATDCYPHRFIGPLRFVGAGSFASCFLFVDTCTGAPAASKQSTRQWKKLKQQTTYPVGHRTLGYRLSAPAPLPPPATAASTAPAAVPGAASGAQSPAEPARSRSRRAPAAKASADVRLFDYTLREAVNLARCSGRPCCTVVIGEYFSIYTCSHTLMLHYTPTQRLSALVGRMGASELQAYLRDLLIGLAASRDPDYRPPADIFADAPGHPCADLAAFAPTVALPQGDVVVDGGFAASELANMIADAEELDELRRYSRDRLIHRDIKPGNFLWHPPHRLPDGTLMAETGVLIDYGLAVVENGAETIKSVTGGCSQRRAKILIDVGEAWKVYQGAKESDNNTTSLATVQPTERLERMASSLAPVEYKDHLAMLAPGLAKFFLQVDGSSNPCGCARFVSARAGTRGYRAPEMLMGLPHSPASDIWSVGSVFLGLLLAQTDLFAPPRPDNVRIISEEKDMRRLPLLPKIDDVNDSHIRPAALAGVRTIEQRTGQVLYELMAIRSFIGAEAFAQVCNHAGVDINYSYAGAPPAVTPNLLGFMTIARQPGLRDELGDAGGCEIFRLVCQMMHPDPAHRPSAAELLEHPWFRRRFAQPVAAPASPDAPASKAIDSAAQTQMTGAKKGVVAVSRAGLVASETAATNATRAGAARPRPEM